MHNINVFVFEIGKTFAYKDFLDLTFICFSSVFYGIFEQFHVQFFATVEELYLNFLIFLSLPNVRNSSRIMLVKQP